MSTSAGEGRGSLELGPRLLQQVAKPDKRSQHARENSVQNDLSPRTAQIVQNLDNSDESRQNFLFADPIAFRYLSEDPCVKVRDRDVELQGYELYFVEQWACSRIDPTSVITTYTGRPEHKILVNVLSLPSNDQDWSQKLKLYLKAIAKAHARRRETPLGTLMVTNLNSFPSALTVIHVPDGNIKDSRENFVVNENLKRLGCSGRAGLNLMDPSPATVAKFRQLYHTSESVPLKESVVELVRLCQAALAIFAYLLPVYVDGLLCDETQQAINDWWTEVGQEYFTIEPSDGILGPTTVSAILGLFLGARNRLNAVGAPVGKDAFDLKLMKRGINYFQKSQKIPRSRRLDYKTLSRLHRVTSKAANSEGWGVQRAVKSTVTELGGRRGELVMGMVGARDRAGIAEVETLDLKKFMETANSEKSKSLWQGKSKKEKALNLLGPLKAEDEGTVSNDEAQVPKPNKRKESETPHHSHKAGKHSIDFSQGSRSSLDISDKEQELRKQVMKSVAGRMSDARSGLGKLRDTVRLKGHSKHHKHDMYRHEAEQHSSGEKKSRTWATPNDSTTREAKTEEHRGSMIVQGNSRWSVPHDDSASSGRDPSVSSKIGLEGHRSRSINDRTPASSETGEGDWKAEKKEISRQIEEDSRFDSPSDPLVRKTSAHSLIAMPTEAYFQAPRSLPRCMSFSAAEDVMLAKSPILGLQSARDSSSHLIEAISQEISKERSLQLIFLQTRKLQSAALPLLHQRLKDIEDIDARASRDAEELDAVYYQKVEEYNSLRDATIDLMNQEKGSLAKAFEELESLGAKLDYELDVLASKVEDVEDGVGDFERQINDLEERTQALKLLEPRKDPWYWRMFGFFTTTK